MAALANKRVAKTDLAKKAHSRDFVVVPNTLDLAQLERIVERHEVVFIEDGDKYRYVTPKLILE